MADFEIAIAGAGPAGAAAAIMLARAGKRVLLADAAPAPQFRIGEGLPPSAKSLLRDLGVWDKFSQAGHRISYGNVSLWGSAEIHQQDFLQQLHGHGFQLDRQAFESMLRQHALELGVSLHSASHLSLLQAAAEGEPHQLQLRSAQQCQNLSADFLLDASGRNASLARKLGAKRIKFDRLCAFHALYSSAENSDEDGRSMIEARPNGWWYSVLLPSGQRLFSFFCDLDLVERSSLLSSTGFHAELMQSSYLAALCQRHAYQLARAPQGVSAASMRLDQLHGVQWLAIGDAALAFDPLSSQGIASAMYGGICAAHALNNPEQGQSLLEYGAHLEKIFAAYLTHRKQYYGLETRWAELPFWQRRHDLPQPLGL